MRQFLYGGVGLMVGVALVSGFGFDGGDGAPVQDDPMVHVMSASAMPATASGDMGSMSGDMAAHMHPARNVDPGLPVPTVTHLVFPDAVDGYNVQILTENFTFTPAAINRAVEDNAGHAHLYVNGSKVGRIYGTWAHLPSALLTPGVNLVSVSLNANDHSEWSVDGVPIASTVRVIRPVE